MKSVVSNSVVKFICTLLGFILISVNAYSQDPGGSPDGPPPAVPIDDYMNLILSVIGVIFALFIIWKMKHKHSPTKI